MDRWLEMKIGYREFVFAYREAAQRMRAGVKAKSPPRLFPSAGTLLGPGRSRLGLSPRRPSSVASPRFAVAGASSISAQSCSPYMPDGSECSPTRQPMGDAETSAIFAGDRGPRIGRESSSLDVCMAR